MNRPLKRYGIPAALLAVSVPMFAYPNGAGGVWVPEDTAYYGGALYFLSTNWLLFQIWRAAPPETHRARRTRLTATLLLGAPTLGLLVVFLILARDVEWMALPWAAAPFAIVAPLWIAALRRVLRVRVPDREDPVSTIGPA